MFKSLLRKKNQTNFNKTLYNFYFWKSQVIKKSNDLYLDERNKNVDFAESNIQKRDIDILKETIVTDNISDKFIIEKNMFSQTTEGRKNDNFSFVNQSEDKSENQLNSMKGNKLL